MSSGFLVFASASALAQAEHHGLGVLENRVEAAILEGRVLGEGVERSVLLGAGLQARVLRLPQRTAGGRRKLLVTRLEPERIRTYRGGKR